VGTGHGRGLPDDHVGQRREHTTPRRTPLSALTVLRKVSPDPRGGQSSGDSPTEPLGPCKPGLQPETCPRSSAVVLVHAEPFQSRSEAIARERLRGRWLTRWPRNTQRRRVRDRPPDPLRGSVPRKAGDGKDARVRSPALLITCSPALAEGAPKACRAEFPSPAIDFLSASRTLIVGRSRPQPCPCDDRPTPP
jgi:hypothetical protein